MAALTYSPAGEGARYNARVRGHVVAAAALLTGQLGCMIDWPANKGGTTERRPHAAGDHPVVQLSDAHAGRHGEADEPVHRDGGVDGARPRPPPARQPRRRRPEDRPRRARRALRLLRRATLGDAAGEGAPDPRRRPLGDAEEPAVRAAIRN